MENGCQDGRRCWGHPASAWSRGDRPGSWVRSKRDSWTGTQEKSGVKAQGRLSYLWCHSVWHLILSPSLDWKAPRRLTKLSSWCVCEGVSRQETWTWVAPSHVPIGWEPRCNKGDKKRAWSKDIFSLPSGHVTWAALLFYALPTKMDWHLRDHESESIFLPESCTCHTFCHRNESQSNT